MDKPIFRTYVVPENKNLNTLAELLERLKHYISLLRNEAKYLGNEKAGSEADDLEKIAETSDLSAITLAILTIEKKLATKTGNDASGYTITVPKGYYSEEQIFTTVGTSTSTNVTDAPAVTDVVAGKDYWANGEHLTGELVDNSGKTINATSNNTETAAEGETITVKVPTAKYDANSVINTGIVAHTTYSYDAEVTVSTDEEGASHAVVKAFDIPAGYYKDPIAIYPKFKEGTEYESVINVKELAVTKSGEFDPHADKTAGNNGFDYYSKVTVAKAVVSSDATLDVANAKATVSVSTKGYTDENSYEVSLPKSTAPSTTDSVVNTNAANVTITPAVADAQSVTIPAGLYTTPTIIKVNSMSSGTTLDSDNISVLGKPTLNAAGTKYTVKINVNDSGYIKEGVYTASDLDKSEISTTNVADNVITAKTLKVSTNEGYTTGETKDLTVQSAVISAFKPKGASESGKGSITISTSTAGWFEGLEISLDASQISTLVSGLTAVETLEYNSTNTSDTIAIANADGAIVNSVTGSYYNSVNMSDLLTELKNL